MNIRSLLAAFLIVLLPTGAFADNWVGPWPVSPPPNMIATGAWTIGQCAAAVASVSGPPVTFQAASCGAGGGGTVTSVSVVSANGLAGTVATATTTPAITLSTSITGILKGNGTAISAATAGTDYAGVGTANNFTLAQTITSTSANALAVGANGATNPVLNVDASASSVATGIDIVGAAAGSGVVIKAITSGTNEALTLNSAGTGNAILGSGGAGPVILQVGGNSALTINATRSAFTFSTNANSVAAAVRFGWVSAADTSLTASTEANEWYINDSATRQWATGAGPTVQREIRIAGPTLGAVGASTFAEACTLCIDNAPIKGTNMTLTQTEALRVVGGAVSTAGTAYGIYVVAPTGATTANIALGISGNLTSNGTITSTGLATAGTIAGSLCATSGGAILYESGATGCTISLEELKNIHSDLAYAQAKHDVMALKPIDYTMKSGGPERFGFGARQVNAVNAKLSTYDGRGDLQAFDPNGILAELVTVVQHQQTEIEALRRRLGDRG